MAEFDVTTGHDTWVIEASPSTVAAAGRFPAVRTGDELRTLLFMPLAPSQVRGKTILSAVLSAPVQANWVSQTLTVQAIATSWNVSTVKWSNKPGVTGATATEATGALASAARFEIDVTVLVQAIADGQANYGWQITTSQSTDRSTIRGFDSGFSSWTLSVETSDLLTQPTQLAPEGVISLDYPTLTVDDVDDLSLMQVQIDAAADPLNLDYDSGWVPVTKPQLDTAVLTANGLPSTVGNTGTFDTDANNWGGSNATLARVTTPVQAGAGALRLTATAGADMSAAPTASAAFMTPVAAGQTVRAQAYSRANTTTRSTRVDIQWYDATPTLLSTTTGTASTNSAASYGLREVSGTAPASAAYFRPRLFVVAPAAAEIHFFDSVKVSTGTTVWAGLADGATTSWRARVTTLNGSTSGWSDWVSIERDTKPTLVMDNPAATTLWDPTPTIAAHLTGPAGDSDTRWQVQVTGVNDYTNVRYDSALAGSAITGATLDHTIPVNYGGRKVFPSDGNYRLVVKAWDRSDRVPSPGDPTYVKSDQTVTLTTDGAITAPNTVTVTMSSSGYPEPVIHWLRASDPDYFTLFRDGELVLSVTPDDCRVSPGVFEWPDESAEPNVSHTYSVRAVTTVGATRKSSASASASPIIATVKGVWVRSDFGDLQLYGDAMEASRTDKRQTFDMPYRAENVDIVTAIGGFEGTYAGVLDRRSTNMTTDLTMIESLRDAPASEVRLVWGTHNVWANLRNPQAVISNSVLLPWLTYDVTFGFQEIDPRD